MSIVIMIAAICGITAASMTNVMSQARILYSYAKDGLFFKVFAEMDPVAKVPVKGSWLAIFPIAIGAFVLNLN